MERFQAKYTPEPNSGCWLWTASCQTGGYGQFWDGERLVLAHRFAYEQANGPIPDGLTIDHKCRVRTCVNPDHLEAVTLKENIMRSPISVSAVNAAKTHCKHGHEFTPENTYYEGTFRRCKACNRAKSAKMRVQRNEEQGRTPLVAPADRTHCPQGHEYDEENTHYRASGKRQCRACDRERAREAYRAKQAQMGRNIKTRV